MTAASTSPSLQSNQHLVPYSADHTLPLPPAAGEFRNGEQGVRQHDRPSFPASPLKSLPGKNMEEVNQPRKIKALPPPSDSSILRRLLEALKSIPIIGWIVSAIEAACLRACGAAGNNNASPQACTPMLNENEMQGALKAWIQNPFSENDKPLDHVYGPGRIKDISDILLNPRNDPQGNLISPICIPFHVGRSNSGHWVTLFIHTNVDGQRKATLFDSINSSEHIQSQIQPILEASNMAPLQVIKYNLQQHLRLSCGIFSTAAIDAVMTEQQHAAQEKRTPLPIDEILHNFAKECMNRSAEEQYQWDAERRANINTQTVFGLSG